MSRRAHLEAAQMSWHVALLVGHGDMKMKSSRVGIERCRRRKYGLRYLSNASCAKSYGIVLRGTGSILIGVDRPASSEMACRRRAERSAHNHLTNGHGSRNGMAWQSMPRKASR